MTTHNPLESLDRHSRDEFDIRPSIPFLQFDNHPDGGLAITTENIDRSHFDVDLALSANWQSFTRPLQRGGELEGLVTRTPVLSLIRRGQLRRYDRATHTHLGIFERQLYDRATQYTRTRYLIALLAPTPTGGYELLHEEPLQITLRGINAMAFGSSGGHLALLEEALIGLLERPKAPRYAFALHPGLARHTLDTEEGSTIWALQPAKAFTDKKALLERFVGERVLEVLTGWYDATVGFDRDRTPQNHDGES